MNNIILDQYKITFQNQLRLNRRVKIISSPHKIMNQFVSDDTSIEDIDETIDALTSVLDGDINHLNFSSKTLITVDVTSVITKFYVDPDFDNLTPVEFSLPTLHLKEIVKSWKEFILQ